jgi:hypothetical protein
MFEHLLRYVREENWFQILKYSRHLANARNFCANLDRGRVCFAIELEEMQAFSFTAQDIEVGSVEATAAGQNTAKAVHDGLNRRLLDHRAGHIEQSSIPAISWRRCPVIPRHAHETITARTELP